MEKFSTPMMKQYTKIKKQYPDCLLFFRLGDFYELFLEDAKVGARVLNITLTSRHKGRDGKIPMAGVPYHAVDIYLSKLVKSGYKVAICEQMSEPDGTGIVDREVVRIVTPGTVLDEKTLEKKENNYLVSLTIKGETLGIAAADLSTGDFQSTQFNFENLQQALSDELSRFKISECILPESLYSEPKILKILKKQKGFKIYFFYEWDVFTKQAQDLLKKHFALKTLAGFGLEKRLQAQIASAALLGYLKYTQRDRVGHIKKISFYTPGDFLILDRSTILNLELLTSLREASRKGALIEVLDQTITAMGARLLRSWLLKPLTNRERIIRRLNAVEEFLKQRKIRQSIREELKNVADIERLVSRLSVGIGNGRDLLGLKNSLNSILKIKESVKSFSPPLINAVYQSLDPDLLGIVELVDAHIVDEPPVEVKHGGLILEGISEELDDLRRKVGGGKDWMAQLEVKERKKTGINSLKVRFNKVFGYYIEVSKANLDRVPAEYIRKQTLVNAERFITPELKKQEELVLTAEEKINKLEYELFLEVVEKVLRKVSLLQEAARGIAALDVLLSFSYMSEKENYCKPEIVTTGEINIKEGRHTVVEKLLEDKQFVPNDVSLDHTHRQLLIITGPNMAGKSVYIRQVALIALLAQMGCFVPAKTARISPVDRIFVRSGAQDVIALGLSTFMVEMIEAANILNHATKDSLVILDEVGRGTSTYDGVSIAWAVAEYLVAHPKVSPKTLFATHYHELQDLAQKYQKIKNYQMAVEEEKGEPIFLHKVVPGGASHSYGIAVAKLAGVPKDVIYRAVEVLKILEQREVEAPSKKMAIAPQEQMTIFKEQDHPVLKALKDLEIDKMTPLEALEKLSRMKENV